MRTQKNFNPNVLQRFSKEGRGTGTYADYIPWHRVSRSDPSSYGRSHLIIWRERQRELLSDVEWNCVNFAAMLPNVLDLVEQFPLHQEDAPLEILACCRFQRHLVKVEDETDSRPLRLL